MLSVPMPVGAFVSPSYGGGAIFTQFFEDGVWNSPENAGHQVVEGDVVTTLHQAPNIK
jgi:hypothetical protein